MANLSFYRDPTLSDGFGSRLAPRKNPHKGLDFPHALGTPVPAYSAGVVVTSEENPALGCIVQVKGDDGRFVGYRHLRRSAPRLQVGARVKVGTIIGQVSDTGKAAFGYHLCTTNSSNARGVFGETGVADPWPYIQRAMNGNHTASIKPTHSGYRVGPVIRSGADWSWAEPEGELAKRVQRALSARGRYNYDSGRPRPDDGEFGENTRKGVQLTLAQGDIFKGRIDGEPGRGAAYGIQKYAAKRGDYTKRGGVIDGKPRVLSWDCFALGLERP